jgi:hypothetical protein
MPAPHRVDHTYHNFRGNKINNYALKKSCIFVEIDDFLTMAHIRRTISV